LFAVRHVSASALIFFLESRQSPLASAQSFLFVTIKNLDGLIQRRIEAVRVFGGLALLESCQLSSHRGVFARITHERAVSHHSGAKHPYHLGTKCNILNLLDAVCLLDGFVVKCIFNDMGKALRRRHDEIVDDSDGHVTEAQLRAFRVWIESQGLASTTAAMYEHDARAAAEAGFIARLRAELAPKTLHRIRAAGRQWAKFRGDAALELALKDFKLPAARRQTVKMPIERAQLLAILDELARANYLSSAMLAVIGLMACRGFRVGDVLRMRRTELIAAFETGVLSFLAKGRRRLEFGLMPSWEKHARSLVEIEGWTRIEDLISPKVDEKKRRKAASKAVQRALSVLAGHCDIVKMYPHRLRRTYAVEYLRQHAGDPEALLKLTQHMQWADESTALQYVNHVRGRELDAAGERIFAR